MNMTSLLLTSIPWLRFLHCKSSSSCPHPHPHTVLFERNSRRAAHTSGVESYSFPTRGQDVYINYLKFFCTRDFSLLCRSTFSSYSCQESNFRQPLPFFFSSFVLEVLLTLFPTCNLVLLVWVQTCF